MDEPHVRKTMNVKLVVEHETMECTISKIRSFWFLITTTHLLGLSLHSMIILSWLILNLFKI
jgi:hypothetical protein